ncbi:glycosyltransferase [Tenuifilum thalassicum]|uniref:Glycosyltransferase family 4 protein n=1 Tax=Tenuifilum thalassicum TaxID=2590900 RepID=A0A7D4BEC1_9BACT|nr:glycosyltransferase [Tenuifilum thalassicum]QKG79898.1 glycosyltransferase family 4 protein [Tenuifilum thalassicum]
MRILQIVGRFDFGGAENHVRELCNHQAALGQQVYLLSQRGRQMHLLSNHVNYIQLPKFASKLLFFHVAVIVFIILTKRINIIHAHQRLPIISACIAGWMTRTSVIATVHGRTKHDLRSILSQRLLKQIIFVSNRVMENSKNYNSIRHKSIVIPNGIPLPITQPQIEPFTIGYFSRIDKRHFETIKLIINAIIKLKGKHYNIKLKIYGEGEEVDNLKHLIEDTNIRYNDRFIIYSGLIENLEFLDTFPELVVGVGRVAIESLARGSNLLSANNKRMGEVITTQNFQFYSSNNFVNVDGVAPTESIILTTLSNYYLNRTSYKVHSEKISKLIQENFSISKTTTMLNEIYHKALTESR